jgi:hypothetical protein
MGLLGLADKTAAPGGDPSAGARIAPADPNAVVGADASTPNSGPTPGGDTSPDTGSDPDAGGSSDADVGDGTPNVTPDEQAAYDQFVKNSLEILYPHGEQAGINPQIIKQLSVPGDPVNALAQTTIGVVVPLQQSAEKSGAPWTQDDQLKSDIVLHGGIAIMEELATIAQSAKIHTYTQDELQGATYSAMDLYRQIGEKDGSLNTDDLKQQFDQIISADKAGAVQSVLPQLPADGGATDNSGSAGPDPDPDPGPDPTGEASSDLSHIDPMSVASRDARSMSTSPDATLNRRG